MTSQVDGSFRRALKKPPPLRTAEDLSTIYHHLYNMDVLSHLREHQLRSMCNSVRYERHEANHILFCPENFSTCWYILLTGSVFVKEHMFLARCCFGRQLGGRRGCECITLQPSEMIVVSGTFSASRPPLSR
nr:rap guanine nucleotide exchange factor 6-like [Paramormyrops kingsleyae]